MELGAFAAALVRRWYLVVVALGLAAGACALTVTSVGPTYETSASVLLFPPSSDGTREEQTSGNPYLELNGLNSARDILIRSVTSQSARDAITKAHPEADYALAPDTTSGGPVIVISVSAPTVEGVLGAQTTLLTQVPVALLELQRGLGLSPRDFITAREITVDDRAETVHKSQVRAGIVATAGVITLTLALIGLIDGLLASRAQRIRDLEPASGIGAAEEPTDEAPARPTVEAETDGQRVKPQREVHQEDVTSGLEREPEPKPPPASPVSAEDRAAAGDVHARAVPADSSVSNKQARKLARRTARNASVRAAREQARELDRAGA